MKVLSKISLRAKLLVLVLLPFLVLGVFTFDKISSEKREIKKMADVRMNMTQIERMSGLIHEFQKERDFAINFLLNPIYDNQIQIERQVKQTDSIISNYREYLEKEYMDMSNLELFNEIENVRANLTGFSVGPEEIQSYYSQVIGKFLDKVASMGANINTPLTREEIKAYLYLVQTKENLGKIRNSVNEALVFGMFQRLGYGQFSGYKGAFESNLNSFVKYSPEELRSRFVMDLQGGTMMNTLEMIDYCFEAKTNRLTDFNATDWWLSATGTINVLYELETFVIGRIKNNLKSQEDELQSEIDNLYVLLSGVLTLVLLLVSFTAKGITSELKKIEVAAQAIKSGKTNVQVEVGVKDEIGKLAEAFNEMAQNSNKLAEVAEKIGKGDYDVSIEERSDDDVLGKALIRMKTNLKQTTKELNRKLEEIEQAYKYKSDFLANMSHELRTPLNSMLILSNLLAENKDGNLNVEEVQSAEVIHQSGSNLLELINDILDLSKIEAGKLEVDLHEVDLPKVIQHLYHLFSPVSKENKLSFSVVQKSEIPEKIISDELRLGQIIKNLISNSMKFTPSGGSVNLTLEMVDDQLEFSVVDSGIGIPKEKQEAIFGAFNQADGSTSRKYGGTGLGLSITANLVSLLKGTINIESEEGKGAKFIVRIPIGDLNSPQVSLPKMAAQVQIDGPKKEKKLEKVNPVPKMDTKEEQLKSDLLIKTEHKEKLTGKKMLIIDEDISNVFELSGKLMELQLEIEEAGNEQEFKAKTIEAPDVLLVNKNSMSSESLETIMSNVGDLNDRIIEVGNGSEVGDISDIAGIIERMMQLPNL